MTIDKNELMNHYKVALEYFYHHDTINMQIYMAFGIVISLFLAAIGLIFSRDFPLCQECVYVVLTKVGVLALFGSMLFYFCHAFQNRAKTFAKYAKIIQTITDSSELKEEVDKGLLFKADLCETTKQNKRRLCLYKIFSVIAFISLALFLFLFLS